MHDGFVFMVVEGVTEDGRRFRPSDWVERLIDTIAVFGADRRQTNFRPNGHERRQRQITFLHAQVIDGNKCLIVDGRLCAANPPAYAYLVEFIRGNQLRCHSRDEPLT